MSIPRLPAEDRSPGRAARLARQRQKYRWGPPGRRVIAATDTLPWAELPALGWILKVVQQAFRISSNNFAIARAEAARDRSSALRRELARIRRNYRRGTAAHPVLTGLAFAILEGGETRRPDSLAEYAALFRTIPLPGEVIDCQSDESFARGRVAGTNPLVINRLGGPDPQFPVGDSHFAAAVGPGDTLARAFAEGRVYLADYGALADLVPGAFPDGPKFVCPARAMFAVPPAGTPGARSLQPIAIQCGEPPAPLFTPRDGVNWQIAKSIVKTADGTLHEAVSHLGRTHLLLEPIVIAAHRQLDAHHPLSALILPHFEGTLFINFAAENILLADRGPVDALFSGTIESIRRLSVGQSAEPLFNDSAPPALFARRGVDDPALLPDYPYRDDALLLWQAIHRWVSAYLAIYYAGDEAVRGDAELQAWVAELGAPDGGGMKGIGQQGPQGAPAVLTLDYLAQMVALIVFTASAQHAAVNSPQSSLMTYAPSIPLACYAPAPASGERRAEMSYLELLPPLDAAQTALNINHALGLVHYTTLGEYGRCHFRDRRVREPLLAFQQQLESIEEAIEERNRHRVPYSYLLPSRVTQSINI
jgi:arachidonate 15-lipoxygenase